MPSTANPGWQHEKIGNGHIPHGHSSNNAQSSHSKPSQPGANDEGATSAHSTTSSNEGDSEDSDGNGAEADNPDEGDGPGDGMAPSGCTIKQGGKQAGRMNDKTVQHLSCTREKRKRRLNAPGDDPNPPKALKRTRNTRKTGQSDDDDYNGVDLISDSGEEGREVEQLEEMLIIASEEEYDRNATNVSQPPGSISSDGEDWSAWTLGHGLYVTDVPYFNNQIGRVEPSEMAVDAEIFRSASSLQDRHLEPPRSPEPRRVRFAEQAVPLANRSRTNSADQGERVTPSQGPENPDSEEYSCGNSSGYESGFYSVQCHNSLKANIRGFQRILERLLKKRSLRVRSPHGHNYLCDVLRFRRRTQREYKHQLLPVRLLRSPEIVAGVHAWDTGSPIQPNLWLSSTVMARLWLFAVQYDLRKSGTDSHQLSAAAAAPRIRVLVRRSQN